MFSVSFKLSVFRDIFSVIMSFQNNYYFIDHRQQTTLDFDTDNKATTVRDNMYFQMSQIHQQALLTTTAPACGDYKYKRSCKKCPKDLLLINRKDKHYHRAQ